MTDVRFCKVQSEKNHPWPRNGTPGKAPIRFQVRPSARDDPKNPPRRGRLGPSWRGLGPSGEGRRVGGRDVVEDSVGQQATLTSCQPGSDTPGSPVGLWAGDRPPSAQVRTIIPPQVHRPGQSGNPPLGQAGSRLLVNPDISHVQLGRRRRRTVGIGVAPGNTNIEI